MAINRTIKTAAKVNLTLGITGTRGPMHTLETVVSSINLYDEAEYALNTQGSARVSSFSSLQGFEAARCDALLKKAAVGFETRYGAVGCDVKLKKNIPPGAGLGGSSAATVCLLRALISAAADEGKRIVPDNYFLISLGSDVPYMFNGGPAVLTGIGEKIEDLVYSRLYFLIVMPGSGVDSGECYKLYEKLNNKKYTPDSIGNGKSVYALGDVLASGLYNDLQAAAELLNPDVVSARKALEEAGAVNIVMSGSGSSVTAVYRSRADALNAARNLRCGFPCEIYGSVDKKDAVYY